MINNWNAKASRTAMFHEKYFCQFVYAIYPTDKIPIIIKREFANGNTSMTSFDNGV